MKQPGIGLVLYICINYPVFACADPSLFFIYDEFVNGMLASQKKQTPTEFVKHTYQNTIIEKTENIQIELDPYNLSNRARIGLKEIPCKNQNNCKLEIYVINHFLYLANLNTKPEQIHHQDKLLKIDLHNSGLKKTGISFKNPGYYSAVIAVVGPSSNNNQPHQTYYYNFAEAHWHCGKTIYAHNPQMAGYLNYCETTRRGGYYYDPWQHDVQSAICSGYREY